MQGMEHEPEDAQQRNEGRGVLCEHAGGDAA